MKSNSGIILRIIAIILIVIAFITPWFVDPEIYISLLVISALVFLLSWAVILIINSRKSG